MPSLVSQEQLDACHVALTIQVAPEDLQKAIESVFNQFAKRTTVPGFRPGKAPRHLVKRFIDESRVQEMALDRSLNDAYRAALKEAQVKPYGNADPQVDLPNDEVDPEHGYTFKATVALEPTVELGPLDGLTARRYVTPIADPDVEKEIQRIADRVATFEPTDEPAQDGDRVRAAIHVTVEGELVEGMHFHHPTLIQVGTNFEEFDAGLRGIKAEEEKAFQFTYPDNAEDEELRGKTADARVEAVEVLRRTVPPIDEAFAAKAGFDSLDALRQRLRDGLQAQADAAADSDVNNSLVDAVIKRATVHYPDEMVDQEATSRLNNLIAALQQRGATLDDYLAARKTDLAAFQADLREQSRQAITSSLVVLELGRQNQIKVTPGDVQEEIKRRADLEGVKAGEMRRLLAESGDLDSLDDRIFFRKLAAVLREHAEIKDVEA